MEVQGIMKQKGKITFTGFVFLLLILYGGFAAVQLISASLMDSQIENEVKDTIGFIRGADLTEEKAYKAIKDILQKNKIIFDEKKKGALELRIDRSAGKIFYHFRYDVEINLIFFKQRRTVEVKNEMRNYA
jgi:hypothetical protein